ncbi:uncharacterized protein SOCEGT47_063660 [Sorangium cellulosum]|uniref:Uncharacterized protein n=1 Tax=Sorangium cellulosum TaxID=56 RepID=A0A4P2Q8B8_SORCE|nr:uncharacterized protein SOCEGT47_063660 [Sorangium cellulosum]
MRAPARAFDFGGGCRLRGPWCTSADAGNGCPAFASDAVDIMAGTIDKNPKQTKRGSAHA